MISLDWVKDYIDIENENPKELAKKVTTAGINVEKVITSHIDHLVIGKVVECVNHPDSDHLHICKVDVGSEVLQIVCGAPNVREGIKVIVALVGAILPGDFEIKAGNIRGVSSNGMLCALFELGLEEKTEENYNKGIHEVDSDVSVGEDANIYLGTNDTLLELDVHKHRNNDCYYHIGFAYEIACILNKKVTLPIADYKEDKESVNDIIKLNVETDKCPYYLAKMVKNVKIGPSPEFIKKRLIAAGMRSINNVVDISNYVMLEYGQPLHFFDKEKLGNNILVRNAFEGECIKTLDGVDRDLSLKDIVITDGQKPVCIAGVMGGENTDVDENTKDILIESAIFDAISIRCTAARLDLRSEASVRYGKGLSYEYTKMAIDRACYLLEKYADATILSGLIKHDNIDKTPKIACFSSEQVSKILGMVLDDDEVKDELDRLDFAYEFNNGVFNVTIPTRRLDIDPNVNDIAEEIGRLYGYNNLVSTLPKLTTKRGVYVGNIGYRKSISKRLRSLGLTETKNYTLTSPKMASMFRYEDKEQIVLPNPMSTDKSVVRTSLIPSLISVYDYNVSRGTKNVLIYEIANTYDSLYNEDTKIAILMNGNYMTNEWMNSIIKCDFYVLKGIVCNLLDFLGFKNRYSFVQNEINDFHPGVGAKIIIDREEVGVIGRIHPTIKKDDIFVCELSMTKLYNFKIKPLKYKEANKYPEIVKDVCFVVDKDVASDTLKSQIRTSGGRLLSNIDIFDLYDMGQEKSIAYKLTFKDESRTLSDDEVMEVFNKIIFEVEKKCNAKLRA